MKKRVMSALTALCLIVSVLSVSAFADYKDGGRVVYLNNGYYIVYDINEEVNLQPSSTNAVKQKSGSAIGRLYDSSDTLIISLTLKATFKYDGNTAEALSASYSYTIHTGGWKFESGNASCDGDTAKATAVFSKFLLRDKSLTVTLTCSPTGTLS